MIKNDEDEAFGDSVTSSRVNIREIWVSHNKHLYFLQGVHQERIAPKVPTRDDILMQL